MTKFYGSTNKKIDIFERVRNSFAMPFLCIRTNSINKWRIAITAEQVSTYC